MESRPVTMRSRDQSRKFVTGSAHCSAVSNPCTMTQLFMYAVKQDATNLLFTAVARCIL